MHHKPGAEARLISILDDVSDPLSPRYGQHLSAQETQNVVAIPGAAVRVAESLDAEQWCDLLGDALRCRAPVKVVEEIFKTTLFNFHATSQESGELGKQQIIRAMGPTSIPAEIADLVAFVTGVTSFLPAHRRSQPVHDIDASAAHPMITPGT